MYQEINQRTIKDSYDFSTNIRFNPGQTSSLLYRLLRGSVESGISNVKTLNYEEMSDQDMETLAKNFPWIRIVTTSDTSKEGGIPIVKYEIEVDVEGIKKQFKHDPEVARSLFFILNETFKQFPSRFSSFNFIFQKFKDNQEKIDKSFGRVQEGIMEIAQSVVFLDSLVSAVKDHKAEYPEEIGILSGHLQDLLTSMQGVILYLGESKNENIFNSVYESVTKLTRQLAA